MKVRRPVKELIAGVQIREDGENWPNLQYLLRAELTGLTCGLDTGTGCRGGGSSKKGINDDPLILNLINWKNSSCLMRWDYLGEITNSMSFSSSRLYTP